MPGATWSRTGLISTRTDIDVFATTLSAGTAISVLGSATESNIDLALEIRNSAGELLVSVDPPRDRGGVGPTPA